MQANIELRKLSISSLNFSNDKQQQYVEIAWETVNKPLADCYALGGPPTVIIAV